MPVLQTKEDYRKFFKNTGRIFMNKEEAEKLLKKNVISFDEAQQVIDTLKFPKADKLGEYIQDKELAKKDPILYTKMVKDFISMTWKQHYGLMYDYGDDGIGWGTPDSDDVWDYLTTKYNEPLKNTGLSHYQNTAAYGSEAWKKIEKAYRISTKTMLKKLKEKKPYQGFK